MTWTEFWKAAQGWQTVIGSVLGFCALIAGALFNYHLNRKRDDRLRQDDMKAIASAIYGEIIPLRAAMARLAGAVAYRFEAHGVGRFRGEPFGATFREAFRLPDPRLFTALSDKVGKLPPAILLGVVTFYESYSAAKEYLLLLEEDEQRGVSYGVLWFLKPAMTAVQEIGPTLALIETLASIEPATTEPETGKATATIAWEEEQQAEMMSAQD